MNKEKKTTLITLDIESYNKVKELTESDDRTVANYIAYLVKCHIRNTEAHKKRAGD